MKMEGEINPDNENNTNLNVLNLKILVLIPLLFLAVLVFSMDDSATADIYVNASGWNRCQQRFVTGNCQTNHKKMPLQP